MTKRSNTVETVVSQVRTAKQASVVVAELLNKFASETASVRLTEEATKSKQTTQEVARRITTNLFTSLRNTR